MFDTQIQNRGIKELKRCAEESVADLMDSTSSGTEEDDVDILEITSPRDIHVQKGSKIGSNTKPGGFT